MPKQEDLGDRSRTGIDAHFAKIKEPEGKLKNQCKEMQKNGGKSYTTVSCCIADQGQGVGEGAKDNQRAERQ